MGRRAATLAAANEVVWRTMSDDAWVKIETFGFPIAMFIFLWAQIMALQSHLIDEDEKDPEDDTDAG